MTKFSPPPPVLRWQSPWKWAISTSAIAGASIRWKAGTRIATARPREHTLRRWRNFGRSGAKLIWGGEAAAVVPEGRANPNQTLATPENRAGLAALLDATKQAHAEQFGDTADLCVGLQLTHSGRFCRPNGPKLEPRIAYHHPLLDAKFGIDPQRPLSAS